MGIGPLRRHREAVIQKAKVVPEPKQPAPPVGKPPAPVVEVPVKKSYRRRSG